MVSRQEIRSSAPWGLRLRPGSGRRVRDRRPRVLLVEDDRAVRSSTAALLREHGYRVIPCSDAPGLFRAIRTVRPDVVLMDLALPGMNGLDAARNLRLDIERCDVPLVALSASWLASHPEMLAAAGFDAALRKPVPGEALVQAIQRVCGARGGRQ